MRSYDLGLAGEESAALYLEAKGYRIIGRRVRINSSEVDLIAEDEACTIFAEVKTRRAYPSRTDFFTAPSASVDRKKREYLLRAAEDYLRESGIGRFFRIDVIEVYADPMSDEYKVLDIIHVENAVRKSGKFVKNTQNNSFNEGDEDEIF